MAGEDGRTFRWTADTETAFLLALRLTGTPTAAAREIGRTLHGARLRRRRLPAFAERWDAVLDELHGLKLAAERSQRRADGDVGPDGLEGGVMPNQVRFDGFTPLRQRAFLRALTETGSYAGASRAVNISTNSVKEMRRRYPSFDEACAKALARSAATLEQLAYERATQGWDEPIVHAGKIVGHRRRYSDALLRLLLQREARRETAKAADARVQAAKPKPRMTTEEVNDLLIRKLDALADRTRREERERQIAWADGMVARGLAP